MNDLSAHTMLSNRVFDELAIGDRASLARTVTEDDVRLFAASSGDVNPAHLDPDYAATDMFGHVVIHGMWTASQISTVLGTCLPGPGTVYLGQDLRFRRPVAPGDTITTSVTVKEKHPDRRIVLLETTCRNQAGEEVLSGVATVIAPDEKLSLPRMPVPQITMRRQSRFEAFLDEARAWPLLRTAIVHPCSDEAIIAVIEARDAGLLEPVIFGPLAKVRAAAEHAGVVLDGIEMIDAEHSHEAAALAVAAAARGQVDALMKGSLHSDELLGAVVQSQSGLRTGRRISHVYLMDVPAYDKLLAVTDAAISILPTLEQKRDICQNAIDLMHKLGLAEPLVAVLAAVETVNSAMPATLDAAALTQMAARGQITGARVDGPLAFDNAVNLDAARIKEIVSPVAGRADILLVPSLETGNVLAKQLVYLAGADAAGLVLGARVPIILTSRSDSTRSRLVSAALAKMMVHGTAPKPAT